MSRQLDQKIEDRARRAKESALLALYGGLEDAISHAGGELTGFSVKLRGYDTLMTVRALFPAGAQVAFVGAEDLPAVFVKAMKEGKRDELRWRGDTYAEK